MTEDPRPRVTIVVTQRDHLSDAMRALEALYQHTAAPFHLLYVDTGPTGRFGRELVREARRRGFALIRSERQLLQNEARNLAFERVETPYVVFLDNDMIVASGWLTHLLDAADATGAEAVGPMICEGEPLHRIVHAAGGRVDIIEQPTGSADPGRHLMVDQAHYLDPVEAAPVERQETGMLEVHGVLVRTDFFRRIGGFDEAMRNTREHVDFSLSIKQAGGRLMLEPAAMTTLLLPTPVSPAEARYFLYRWNAIDEVAGLEHMARKWNLTWDESLRKRKANAGWRKSRHLIKPWGRRMLLGLKWRPFTRWLERIDASRDAARVAQNEQARSGRRH